MVVLRLRSDSAWEVLATDALMLEQHGRRVRIVANSVTGLLFDDAILVRAAPVDADVLVFHDRRGPSVGAATSVIAHQGPWSIARGHGR
jgi:hypothetical protein